MRQWVFALAVLGLGLAGALWMHSLPAGEAVSAYRQLSFAEYRVLRGDAMAYAASPADQGFSFHADRKSAV